MKYSDESTPIKDGWICIPKALIENPVLSAADKLTYIALAYFENTNGPTKMPSPEEIEELINHGIKKIN